MVYKPNVPPKSHKAKSLCHAIPRVTLRKTRGSLPIKTLSNSPHPQPAPPRLDIWRHQRLNRKRLRQHLSGDSLILPMGVRDSTFCLRCGSSSSALPDILVSMNPGATQFTLMPWGDSSTAMALVMPSMALFEAV